MSNQEYSADDQEELIDVIFGRLVYAGWRCRISGTGFSGGGMMLFQKNHAFLKFELTPENATRERLDPTFDWMIHIWRHAKPILKARENEEGDIYFWEVIEV